MARHDTGNSASKKAYSSHAVPAHRAAAAGQAQHYAPPAVPCRHGGHGSLVFPCRPELDASDVEARSSGGTDAQRPGEVAVAAHGCVEDGRDGDDNS